MTLRTVTVTRYVTPLREGGSLPAIVEADDDGIYVLKFRGAGQGPKALIAELVAGEIARAAGLPVPEIVFAELDPELARTEPDPEIQALIRASAGLNLALDYLPGSVMFDVAAGDRVDADLASRAVWFDAFVTNVDRTARNPNLLCWHKNVYFIDHGAALYFHHAWRNLEEAAWSRFSPIRQHLLLRWASRIEEVNEELRRRLSRAMFADILDQAPDAWLLPEIGAETPAAKRAAYVEYLSERLDSASEFVEEAIRARAQLV